MFILHVNICNQEVLSLSMRYIQWNLFSPDLLGREGCVHVSVTYKIFNPPFPVLKAGHSVSYSCVCDVDREWVNGVGFFLNFPVWLACYAHVFHA